MKIRHFPFYNNQKIWTYRCAKINKNFLTRKAPNQPTQKRKSKALDKIP